MTVMNTKNIVCVIITLLFVFPLTSAVSNEGLELGTQFEGSVFWNAKDASFSVSSPSSVPSLGTSLPSLYVTWYPNEYIGLTSEGGFGFSTDSGIVGHGGLGFSYLPFGYSSSTVSLSVRTFYSGLYLSNFDMKDSHLVGIGPCAG